MTGAKKQPNAERPTQHTPRKTTAKWYRVEDPQAVYPIVAVEVLAVSERRAKIAAFEAMAGCRATDVDYTVLTDTIDTFSCLEITRTGGRSGT